MLIEVIFQKKIRNEWLFLIFPLFLGPFGYMPFPCVKAVCGAPCDPEYAPTYAGPDGEYFYISGKLFVRSPKFPL